MTDEEKKAWEEEVKRSQKYVDWYKRTGGMEIGKLRQSEAILAADAELKRLREAVEWAINKALEIGMKEDTVTHPMAFAAELRRRLASP